eukprot:4275603-Pyramimonas_sp.AAC.1
MRGEATREEEGGKRGITTTEEAMRRWRPAPIASDPGARRLRRLQACARRPGSDKQTIRVRLYNDV